MPRFKNLVLMYRIEELKSQNFLFFLLDLFKIGFYTQLGILLIDDTMIG